MKNIHVTLATSLLVTLVHSAQSFASDEDDFLVNDASIVLSPARLKQAISDVPASVTVITADMLEKFGVKSLPDALMFVPGMEVTRVTGSDYRINYHGTNITNPRRINVLIDGMSIYRPAFARVNWAAIPIAIEDIQRIEVTRGSNSASYGSNSMMAIINIISKHPQDVKGLMLSGSVDTKDSINTAVRYGGEIGRNTHYSFTAAHEQNNGFENTEGFSTRPNFEHNHDAATTDKVNFHSVTELSSTETLDVQAAWVRSRQEVQMFEVYQASFPDRTLEDVSLNLVWKSKLSDNHELKIQSYYQQGTSKQEWRECLPTMVYLPELGTLWKSNPAYVKAIVAGKTPTGGTATDNQLAFIAMTAIRRLGAAALAPNCGNTNQSFQELRGDVELQDTYVFSDRLRLVSGAGFRRDKAISETHLKGGVHNDTLKTFINLEYKVLPSTNVNVGAFYEDQTLNDSSFSPRLAINTHLNERNSLRFIISKAQRTPNIVENALNWSYMTTGLERPINGKYEATYAASAISTGDLRSETNISKEIGYNGNFSNFGLVIDAKIFEDDLSNLVSDRLNLINYRQSNKDKALLKGAEFQVNYTMNSYSSFFAGYTYLQNSSSTQMEKSQFAKNSGFIAARVGFANGLSAAFSAKRFQAENGLKNGSDSQSLTLTKPFKLNRTSLTPTLSITHMNQRTVRFLTDINEFNTNYFSGAMQYNLGLLIAY